ncbi:MAG: HepT-like ribonuclease domain-containing protein [Nocardioidaceae bacterium]
MTSRRRRSDAQHLEDAGEHLRVLKEHLGRGPLTDALVLDAVCKRLESAIDSVDHVSDELLATEFDSEEWSAIVGMRVILAHHYIDRSPELVERTITNRLQALESSIAELARTVGDAQ